MMKNKLAMAVALVAAASSSITVAQTVLEEVVVTARKQMEMLQDTPIAMTALDADALRSGQLNNIADIARQVPGLNAQAGVYDAALSIRGVGARARGANIDPAVGVYVDGVFLPRSDTQLLDVVNPASVQVLRGPQGTLFGKNTAGGAVLIDTKKPGPEFEGQLLGRLGNYDQRDLRAAVSGPLVEDTLFAGLSLDIRDRDGFMRDAESGREYGDVDSQSAMAQLRWIPRDDLTVDMFAFWNRQRQQAAPASCEFVNADATIPTNNLTAPGEARDFKTLCDRSAALADDDKVLMDTASKLRFETTNTMAGVTLDWELNESLALKSITGYLQQDDLQRDADQDGTPLYSIQNKTEVKRHLQANGFDSDDEQRRFLSQEFQLNGEFDEWLSYTVGLFGSIENIDDNVGGTVLGPGGYAGVGVGDSVFALSPNTAGFNGAQISDYETTTAALFVHGVFHLSEHWDLTLGGRYGREKKEVEQRSFESLNPGPGLISRAEFDALATATQELVVADHSEEDDSWSKFTPTAQLAMNFFDDWLDATGLDMGMVYFSASRGFKAGGFARFGDDFVAYDPEQLTNYELGLKLDMNDRRLRVNAALFSSDYEDMQLTVARATGPLSVETGLTNAGEATIVGAELEISYLPVEGLLINFTGSWLDAEYDEFDDIVGGDSFDRSGEDFAFVPESSYSLNVSYDWQTDSGVITPSISASYTDEMYIGIDAMAADFEREATLDSYSLWNARVAWVPAQLPQLELSLYGNNLADEDYFASGTVTAETLGVANLQRGVPRTYGAEIFYRW